MAATTAMANGSASACPRITLVLLLMLGAASSRADSAVHSTLAHRPLSVAAQVRFRIMIPATLSLDLNKAHTHLGASTSADGRSAVHTMSCIGTARVVCTVAMP